MKTLLIAALVTSSLAPQPTAEACGNYRREPSIFRLTNHAARTFALVPSLRAPKELVWTQIDPRSFDNTRIADAKQRAHPMTLTLVGPSGTRVVKSTNQVFLSDSWHFRAPTAAFEVAGDGFEIALEGEQPAAKWIALGDSKPSSAKLARWVTAQGVKGARADAIYVNPVPGTNIETVSLYPEGGTGFVTLLKVGDKSHGTFAGSPVGAFSNDGVMQLVLVDGARVTPVYLGAG